MPDRPARRNGLRGGNDRIGVDAVVPVEVGQRAGMAEMLTSLPKDDAEFPVILAGYRKMKPAEPL